MNHPIRCRCGALQGQLQRNGREARLVCYCKDCQAFARYLCADADILDATGGTEVIQTQPRFVTFTAGREHLACMRLSDKGLVRWYAACCNTPIGNTAATNKLAFVGLIHNCLSVPDKTALNAFGPVLARVNGKSALGSPKPKDSGLAIAIWRALKMMLKARLNGSYKQSPFFDPVTNTTVVAPTVLTEAQRRALSPTTTA